MLDDLTSTDASLVLVCAPAGYGKSTVLEQWASYADMPFAWVSLDASENDPVVFWRYLYSAVRAARPSIPKALAHELADPEPDLLGSVIPQLLNELSIHQEDIVIVLDDYHRIDSRDLDHQLEVFVRRMPRTVTLAIATREMPHIGIARLRARGRMLEIGTAALSLSYDEIAHVLRNAHPARTEEEVRWVRERTEGWPAGVYLFSKLDSLRELPETTAGVRKYLIAEMVSAQEPDDLLFMQQTSILSYLDGGVCDHVTGTSNSGSRLDRLSASNLLILPLDKEGKTYRYHHLLQDELRLMLDEAVGSADREDLHRRAMEWSSQARRISEAIDHATQARETDAAVALVSDCWYEYVIRGRGRDAHTWLDHFSQEDLMSIPPLQVAGAMIAAFSGHAEQARLLAASASRAAYDGPILGGAASYESYVAIMQAAMVLNGPAAALADAEAALALEPATSPYRPLLLAMVGTFLYSTVRNSDAQRFLIEASNAHYGPPETSAYAYSNLALMHAWKGDTDSAIDYASRAIERIDDAGVEGLLVHGLPHAVMAVGGEAGERAEERLALLRQAERSERTASNAAPFDSMVLRTTIAEAFAALGDYDSARTYAERALANLSVMPEAGLVSDRLDLVIRSINRAIDERPAEGLTSNLLTPREAQILTLLAEGATLAEIGSQLYVSRNTVKTHTSRIYRKLGVSDRYSAVAAAHRLELIASA